MGEVMGELIQNLRETRIAHYPANRCFPPQKNLPHSACMLKSRQPSREAGQAGDIAQRIHQRDAGRRSNIQEGRRQTLAESGGGAENKNARTGRALRGRSL